MKFDSGKWALSFYGGAMFPRPKESKNKGIDTDFFLKMFVILNIFD